MSTARPQSHAGLRGGILAALLLLVPGPGAAAEPPAEPRPEGEAVFERDTPLGRIAYHAGRGLKLGKTGFTVGGFATGELERLEDGERHGGLEGLNFFLFFDPLRFVHLFAELEVGKLAEAESGRRGVRSDPKVAVERLYADLGASDLLNLRLGKFLTPIGRWNPAPAEPLVWTTSAPVIVEEVFDEVVTGAMLWGTTFPPGGALSYSLYGTFLDPIAPDPEAPPAKRSIGGHLEWAGPGGWALGASYLGTKKRDAAWNHLGGVDALWQLHERVELSGEAVFGEGTRAEGGLWGLYAQAAVETVRTLYAVGRYEYLDPPAGDRPVNLFDLGLAWVPRPWFRIKADYRIANHRSELAPAGVFASVSILF